MDHKKEIQQQIADNIALELKIEQMLEKPELLTKVRIKELEQIRELVHNVQDVLRALSEFQKLIKKE